MQLSKLINALVVILAEYGDMVTQVEVTGPIDYVPPSRTIKVSLTCVEADKRKQVVTVKGE